MSRRREWVPRAHQAADVARCLIIRGRVDPDVDLSLLWAAVDSEVQTVAQELRTDR